jgi:hypothetical protein
MWPGNSRIEWNRPRQWRRIHDMRIATWNVRTLYRAGAGKKGQKTELTGRGPLRRRRSALDCSATEE